MMFKILLLQLMLCSLPLFSQIHVIMTSAVLPFQYEERKAEYVRGIYAIKSYGITPWIIEATNINTSFLDNLGVHVLYPQKHNSTLRNKGVNETLSIRASIPFLPFNDEDIVIKLTGRYNLYDRSFINLIETNADNYDAFVSYGKNYVANNDIFTGCFAMRWKYLKKIIKEMDLEKAERDYIAVEAIFAEFIQDMRLRVKKVDRLNVAARIFFSGEGREVQDF
jgi:hypothetical protein